MLRVATLGPAGSNHELVATGYLQSIGITGSRMVLFEAFEGGVALLTRGDVDCLVQCAAHPDLAQTIGGNLGKLFVVDTFMASSKPLAVLTRAEVVAPVSIGFHPATRSYVDLSAWTEHVEEQSTVRVAEGLLAGRYHSGIAALEIAQRNPARLRVDAFIGPVQDAWVVYATRAVYPGGVVAWRDGPGAVLLRGLSMARDGNEGRG